MMDVVGLISGGESGDDFKNADEHVWQVDVRGEAK